MTSKEAIEYLKGVGYQASAFSRFEPYYEDGTNYKEAVDVIEAELKKAEPVKHGKWVNVSMGVWECSNCKKIYALGFDCHPYHDCCMLYCQTCGAKMDLGEEK